MLVLGAWEAGAGVTPSEQNGAKRGKRFKEANYAETNAFS